MYSEVTSPTVQHDWKYPINKLGQITVYGVLQRRLFEIYSKNLLLIRVHREFISFVDGNLMFGADNQ